MDMTAPNDDAMMVHLTVDDVRTAQAAGAEFARALVGAASEDFMAALVEQAGLIERAVMDAGHSTMQAGLAAEHFIMAAQDEWQRIGAATTGSTAQGNG